MKKLFLLGLVLILISSVSASVNTDNLKAYYYLYNNANDVLGNYNGTDINSPTYNSNSLATNLNSSVYFDGVNQGIDLNNNWFGYNTSGQFYIGLWLNLTSSDNGDRIFRFESTGGGYLHVIERSDLGSNVIRFQVKEDTAQGGSYYEEDIVLTFGTPIFLEILKNGTLESDTYVFQNLIEVGQGDSSNTITSTTFNDGMHVGQDDGAGYNEMFLSDIMFFSVPPNQTTREEIYDSGDGNPYPFTVITPPVLLNGTNTSFFAVDLNISDSVIATNTYTTIHEDQFNLSFPRNITLASALNIEKLTGGLSNDIYARVLHNDVVVRDVLLRTVSSTGEIGSTGLGIIAFQAEAGENNITIQARRTGNGIIALTNFDLILLRLQNDLNNNHRGSFQASSLSFSNTDFKNIYNWTRIGNYSETLVAGRFTVETTVAGNQSFAFQKRNGLIDQSPYITRYTNINTFGSLAQNWIDSTPDTTKNFSIFAKTTGGTCNVNFTLFDFDLRDDYNNTVRSISYSNASTNLTNTILIPPGQTKVVNLTHTFTAGTGMAFGYISSLAVEPGGSTTDVTIYMDSSNASVICTGKNKNRTVSPNQAGNINLLSICNGNLTIGSTYEFNAYIDNPGTDNLILYDENFGGFEITEFNVTEKILNVSINIVNDFINNTINYNQDNLTVNYNFTLGDDNLIDLVNCVGNLKGSTVNQTITQNNRNESTNYAFVFNTNNVEEELTFNVTCSNLEISQTRGNYNINIDTILPTIQSDFVNNSQFLETATVTFNVNFTDNNMFAYNISYFDINDNELQNIFVENLTGTSYFNTSSYTPTSVGNYSIRATAWDSHTKQAPIKPLEWYYQGNNIIVEGVEFTGDFKPDIDKTYFYLSNELDRYKFKVTFESQALIHNINLSFDDDVKVYYLSKSDYKGHFVFFYQDKKRWLDFENDNVKNIEVLQINNKTFSLTVTSYIQTDEIEFESIGDLNEISIVWDYIVASQDTQLLNNILSEIQETNSLLEEIGGALMQIAFVLLIATFLFLGFYTKNQVHWFIASLFIILLGGYYSYQVSLDDTILNYALALSFVILGVVFLFYNAVQLLIMKVTIKDKKKNEEMKEIEHFYQI